MTSLLDNLKKNMSLAIDKEEVEIKKRVVKHNASSFIGAFTGIRKTETEESKEIKRRAAKRRDEYREEHNKMFAGYDGSRRANIVVSKSGYNSVESPRIRQNEKEFKSELVNDQRYGSKIRISSGNSHQDIKPAKPSLSRIKEKQEALPSHSVKDSPCIITRRNVSEEYSPNKFSSELKNRRKNNK